MQLYFVRHGQAGNRQDWVPRDDALRPLTDEGIARMRQSAETMRKLGLRPDVILTSPLTRARQTADIVAGALGCNVAEEPGLAPGFDLFTLSTLLQAHPNGEALLLVGHEPDFSETVSALVGGGNVMVKKGSLVRVDLLSLEPLRGVLIWLIPPRLLAL